MSEYLNSEATKRKLECGHPADDGEPTCPRCGGILRRCCLTVLSFPHEAGCKWGKKEAVNGQAG